MKERIVFAYSGGFDTSVAIPWLAERHDADIVTVTLDLGQGRELEEIRDRALATGAVRAHVLDVREEFAREYILPALQAGALYEGRYPMATALGRPLIAKKLVEIAAIEQTTVIAHGCTGNDQVRIEITARALNPDIRVMGLPREPDGPVAAPAGSPYTIDTNLWGRSIAGAVSGCAGSSKTPVARWCSWPCGRSPCCSRPLSRSDWDRCWSGWRPRWRSGCSTPHFSSGCRFATSNSSRWFRARN